MKKLVKVVVGKEIEVEIADHLLTEEAIAEFSSYMWKGANIQNLFEYATQCIFDGCGFIEGLGEASSVYSSRKTDVKYEELYEEIDAKILEE